MNRGSNKIIFKIAMALIFEGAKGQKNNEFLPHKKRYGETGRIYVQLKLREYQKEHGLVIFKNRS